MRSAVSISDAGLALSWTAFVIFMLVVAVVFVGALFVVLFRRTRNDTAPWGPPILAIALAGFAPAGEALAHNETPNHVAYILAFSGLTVLGMTIWLDYQLNARRVRDRLREVTAEAYGLIILKKMRRETAIKHSRIGMTVEELEQALVFLSAIGTGKHL